MGEELNFHTWELLSAYIDGELDDVAVAMVERAVQHDPDLDDAVAVLRRQKAELQAWSRAVDYRPVPMAIRALLDKARQEQCRCGNEECCGENHCDA